MARSKFQQHSPPIFTPRRSAKKIYELFEYAEYRFVETGESKDRNMKKLITILTIITAALFASPSAEARGCHSRSYVSYHRTCNGPAWVETYIAYYDDCGHPVFRTRVVPIRRSYSDCDSGYRGHGHGERRFHSGHGGHHGGHGGPIGHVIRRIHGCR
jgi:hypothetical protein